MVKIAIANNKGGVSKTTSSLNIAAALRELGKKVLLVDLDSQANLTTSMAVELKRFTVGEFIAGLASFEDALVTDPTGIDLLPSNFNLAKYEKMIAAESVYQLMFKNAMEGVEGYDFVIIDCPPSLTTMTINALMYSEYYLVPLLADIYSLSGVNNINDVAGKLKQLNPKLKFLGAFLSKFNKATNKHLHKMVYAELVGSLGTGLMETTIRENISLSESVTNREDVFRYAPESNGAADYRALTNELLKRIK